MSYKLRIHLVLKVKTRHHINLACAFMGGTMKRKVRGEAVRRGLGAGYTDH